MYATVSEKPSPARGAGQHILIVVDDQAVLELLSTTLELAGYLTGTAASGAEAVTRLGEHPYDLVIVDVTLPDLNGLKGYPRVAPARRPPTLFLAPCEALEDFVAGLSMASADYVVTPLRVPEVLARAQVLLRASGRRNRAPRYADLVLDDATCQARRGRRALDLSPAEHRLLRHLLVNAERVLSKEQIGRHVWGEARGDNAIEKLVSRLRHKVDQEGEPQLLHTRKGFGYWLGR
jgi:DNA-binding response OmpR family regulator